MSKTLLVVDKRIGIIPDNIDYILDFSSYNIEDKRVLSLSAEFKEILEKVKQEYSGFIHDFGTKTGFLERKFSGSSLWWFSEIQHKDSWGDSLLKEIAQVDLIRWAMDKFNITRVKIHSDASLLLTHFKAKSGGYELPPALRLIYGRFKYFAWLLSYLLAFKIKQNRAAGGCLFFGFFPSQWRGLNKVTANYLFRDMPQEIDEACFIIYLDNIKKKTRTALPANSMVIQSYIKTGYLCRQFINLSHFFWYLRRRKIFRANSYFKGIDLWRFYRRYILQTVLYNDFFFSTFIHALRNIVASSRARSLVISGEFGPEAKAATVACQKTDTKSIWYQHSIFSPDKFWFYNHVLETPLMPVPDKMLVWSDYYRDFLEKYSHYPKNRCFVVENIRYSDFIKQDASLKQVGPQKKYFFAPTVSEGEIRHFCYFINRLCREGFFREDQVILKIHPSAASSFKLDNIFSKYESLSKVEIVMDASGLQDFVSRILCLISGGTTLGIEAAFFGLPVIQYIPKYGLNLGPFDEGTATFFSDVPSLKKAFADINRIKTIDYRLFFLEPTLTNKRFKDAINA